MHISVDSDGRNGLITAISARRYSRHDHSWKRTTPWFMYQNDRFVTRFDFSRLKNAQWREATFRAQYNIARNVDIEVQRNRAVILRKVRADEYAYLMSSSVSFHSKAIQWLTRLSEK